MEQVEYAASRIQAHGLPFPKAAFKRIVEVHKGLPPVRIEALPEGTVVPNRVPLYQVVNTDPTMPWLPQFLEQSLLRAVWYPTTVATLSWHIKQDLRAFLVMTCDDPEGELPFRLHDFGGRGASSEESAALGGMAHLVNFMGTDTVQALEAAREFYGEDVAGFSIPAMEHFTVTAWGREGEADAYANMIEQFGGEGRIYACVSDAYDIYNAVDNIWRDLKPLVLAKGGRLVIRPDSGDPVSVVMHCVQSLARSYGTTVNKKGYMVLNPAVRVIQGDGVNRDSIRAILTALQINGYSAENVAFGMGGALLQGVGRDDLGFAQKASAISVDGETWIGIAKDPVTARQKQSKKGRQMVFVNQWGNLEAGVMDSVATPNQLRVVYENGTLVNETTFAEVRANSNK